MQRKKHVIIAVIIAIAVPLSIVLALNAAGDPPVIESLQAELQRVFPADSVQVICEVSARDGGDLSYEWWASGGEIEGEGATATWTAPDFEGVYNIRVTVSDGRNNAVEDYVTIVVEANQPPVIHSLTADAEWAFPGDSLQVICDADDPDGHPLTYEWSASAGHIDGTGHEVTWIAPEEIAVYEITVVVSDGYGGPATRTLHISVMPDQPPVIEKLEVTKDRHGHCYMQKASFGYHVGREQNYDIECIGSDTGVKMSYEWSFEAGETAEVSEDGSMITWTAPDRSVYVTVTVTVSDIAGNSATKSVDLNVVACSVCRFGHCP